MSKNYTALVLTSLLTAILALTPTASADHGWHSCYDEEDPCDDKGTRGCDGLIAVQCTYSQDINCKQADTQPHDKACYHKEYECILSFDGQCQLHQFGPIADVDLS